jgi:hypothetical protein
MRGIQLLAAFCLLLSGITSGLTVLAQTDRQDAVYLRNGSIIRGKVLENVVGKYTRIETVGRNVLVIPEGDVEHLVLDELIPPKDRTDPKPYGYVALADIGFMGGKQNTMSLALINGYQFRNRLSVGAGFGVEKFDEQVIPVFADLRYNFLKGGITPFIYLQGGYSFPLGKSLEGNTTEIKGGSLINPGIGLRMNFTTHNALIFGIGWRYQEIRSHYNYYYYGGPYSLIDNGYDRTDFYRRIAVRIGFVFN